MKSCRKSYPLKRIHFVDDIFSQDTKWLKEFLPLFKKEISIPWSANVWISHMNEELTKLFKETGCVGLTFGVESGSEDTRRNLIDKNLPNETFIKNCATLKKYKIPFHTGNIIGLPGEGIEKAFETAIFNREIGAQSTRAGLFWPFPGTQLTTYAMEHGMLSSDYSVESFNRGIYPIVKHEDSEKLILMAHLFQLVAKWKWFESFTRIILRWPNNKIVKLIGSLVDQSFWFHEALFFGVLNHHGVRYWWHLRKSLSSMRTHESDPRFKDDAQAQKAFWSMSRKDLEKAYGVNGEIENKSRDGLT